MQLLERNQVGKVESFEELVNVVDVGATPLTSMIPKGKKQTQALHNWQVKQYKDLDLEGVPDGVDVTDVDHNTRVVLQGVWQLFRYAIGVSRLTEESSVHGVKNELSEQILDAMVAFKRTIERRIASDLPVRDVDDGTRGMEFRGIFDWLNPNAQTDLPVPADYRPGGEYDGVLNDFDEEAFRDLIRACYKETNGPVDLKMPCGIDLKGAIDLFLTYRTEIAGKTVVQCLDNSRNRVYEETVDRLIVAGGQVDVMEHPFLRNDLTGSSTAGSHLSGLFLNLKMWRINWNSAPAVKKLENRGGGEKRYIDAVCSLMCLNPLGQRRAVIDAVS